MVKQTINGLLSNKKLLVCYNYFGLLAQHGYDLSAEEYSKWGVTKIHNLNLDFSSIKDGDTVFIKVDYLNDPNFVNSFLSSLKDKKIYLLSGNGSCSVSDDMFNILCKSPNIIKWGGTNLPTTDKTEFYPIGFEELDRMPNQTQDILWEIHSKYSNFEKINKIFVPYHSNTNQNRNRIISFIKSTMKNDVVIQEQKQSFEEYLNTIGKYKFTVCLAGSGQDTHRFYETILTGSIPIHENKLCLPWCNKQGINSYYVENWFDIGLYKSILNTSIENNTSLNSLLVSSYEKSMV